MYKCISYGTVAGIVVLSVVFFLAGCAPAGDMLVEIKTPATTTAPTDNLSPTVPIENRETAIAKVRETRTAEAFLTLTLRAKTPSITPVPTRTESPTRTLQPPTATLTNMHPVYPPGTPSGKADEYELKSWGEAEGLGLINELKEIIDDLKRGVVRFDLQPVLILAEREFLLRYPDSNHSSSIRRELAYLEAISFVTGDGTDNYNDQYRVNTLQNLLEEGLNQGEVQIGSIGSWLSSFGFRVVGSYYAADIYGTGDSAKVFHIEASDSGISTHSAVFVVQKTEDDVYHVKEVRERWKVYYPYSSGGKEEIAVDDLNGNGQSEIISIVSAWGHAACSSEISVYEWQKDDPIGGFRDLAILIPHQLDSYINSYCKDIWRFEENEKTPGKDIVVSPGLSDSTLGGCRVEAPVWVRYGWTGNYFEWINEATEINRESEHCEGWEDIHKQIQALSQASEAEAFAMLKEVEYPVKEVESVDITGDGTEDLIVLFNGPIDAVIYGAWALIRDNGKATAIQLPRYIYEDNLTSVKICYPEPDRSQVNVIYFDDDPYIFKIQDSTSGYHIESMVMPYPKDKNPDLMTGADEIAAQCGLPDSYHWDPFAGKFFRTYDPYEREIVIELDEIEGRLFEQGDLERDISELLAYQKGLASHPGDGRYSYVGEGLDKAIIAARVEYLLALVMELSGDEEAAIKQYYRSWQLDPEGLIGMMARLKLVRAE